VPVDGGEPFSGTVLQAEDGFDADVFGRVTYLPILYSVIIA
jgi:hypothetical protein